MCDVRHGRKPPHRFPISSSSITPGSRGATPTDADANIVVVTFAAPTEARCARNPC